MSLPNKLFDYIHAHIPVVASPMPEVARVVSDWKIGCVVADSSPDGIGSAVREVLAQPKAEWKVACERASKALHWGAEEPQILDALDSALSAGKLS